LFIDGSFLVSLQSDGLVGVGLAAAAVGVVASGIAAAVLGSRRR
jgi:hypothetical protein